MSKGVIVGRWRIKPRFIVFICILTVFIFFSYNFLNAPPTSYVVEAGNMQLEYDSEAIIVRDEYIYSAPEYGRVAYYSNEEDRVDTGELVATIFKSDYQEDMIYQLYSIQEKIINYQQENILDTIAGQDIKKIESKIDELVYEIRTYIKNAKLGKLTKTEKELRNLLKKRQELVDKNTEPDSYLKKLHDEKSKITQQLQEWKIDITAPKAGLVSYHIDNLEKVLTFDSLEKIDLNSYKDLIKWKDFDDEKDRENQVDIDSPFFKIIGPEKWYIVCEVDYPEIFFEQNETITVSFLDLQDKILDGQVTRILDGDDTYLLVVEFRNGIEEFINVRNTSVRLTKIVDGLMIPKSAIVKRRSKEGVFKIEDGESIFTGVQIVGESGKYDYVIIDGTESQLKADDAIKLNQ